MQNQAPRDRTLPPNTLPEVGFYAQVDKIQAIQDYSPRQSCIRLTGISVGDFQNRAFLEDNGCQTYVIDISLEEFWRAFVPSAGWISYRGWRQNFVHWIGSYWVFISFKSSKVETNSYAYAAFTESGPQYVIIKKIKILTAKVRLPAVESGQLSIKSHASGAAALSAFHVGQGMCSVYTYAEHQFLLDAGAGKPVTRENYRSNKHRDGALFKNELRVCLNQKNINVIISHLDYDHWCLLEWDLSIFSKLTEIYIPIRTSTLALRSSAIVKKVRALDSCTVVFDQKNYLAVMRTQPYRSNKNGEGLVVVAVCNGLRALLPGDYVYERINSDLNTDLSALSSESYSAVVVPHHGDTASAQFVPPACRSQMQHPAIAFFSAGTHARNRHPRQVSLDAHSDRGYDTVADRECPDIVEQRLL